MILKKRTFLLLEVMIALMLVLLCIFPLIYPHVALAKSQSAFIKKIDLDHAISLIYADTYQKLLTGQIPFSDLEQKKEFVIDEEFLKKYGKNLPYKGHYYFQLVKKRPKKVNPEEASAYLFDLIFELEAINSPKDSKKEPLKYIYKVFVVKK